jgi:hypothetical protein
LWFIYDYGAGRKLYYDLATGTSLSSSAKISDVDTDVNSTTVWAPSTVTVKRSPDRIFSKIHLTYNAGVVTASDAAVATAYRTREAAILDASIVGSTLAQAKADELLANSSEEITEVQGLSVVMPALYVNDIRVGQRVEIKLTRHGVDAYTWFRVIRRTVTPFAGSDVVYTVTLGLASNVLAAATGGRGGDEIWPHKSNAHEDGATVRVDRGGITITDGGITVTNGDDVVIIDGSSDMFRIAATGTLSDTVAAGSGGTETATLTGLGTALSAPLAVVSMIGSSLTSEANAAAVNTSKGLALAPDGLNWNDSYVATSSGGTVDEPAVTTSYIATGGGQLSATPTGTMTAKLWSSSAAGSVTRYFHMRYYVLEQAAI